MIVLSNLRIDNNSGDTVTVLFNNGTYTVPDEEKFYIENVEKGEYEIRIHRTRIPLESADYHENSNGDFVEKMQKTEKSLHCQLDGVFKITVNSSKTVVNVETKVTAEEKLGLDVIFSGYSISATGGKVENESKKFASRSVEKNFVKHHIKEAFLPVGLGGIFLLITSFFALYGDFTGNPLTIGGTKFILPFSLCLTAVALGFTVYTVIVIINILRTAKRLK